MNSSRISISFIVPVYNSASTLNKLIASVESEASGMGCDFELILVNDGSVDASSAIIKRASLTRPWIRSIDLARNYGQHNALLCGVRAAKYKLCVTLDDDLQNPVSEVQKMIEELLNNQLDVVYGFPKNSSHGVLRNCASMATKIAMRRAMGAKTAQHISSFRVFRRHVSKAFERYENPFINLDVLLTWGTSKFGSVAVEHRKRDGESTYTLRKLITHALNMITGFSTLPLQIAGLNGLALIGFGLILLVYILFKYLAVGSPVPGFTFLASIIIVFSGAQLLALGIIGEYIGRIYARTMDTPSYSIASENDEYTELFSAEEPAKLA